ncbi:MAG TPA: hypothetical protein VJH63_02270 [Candidatus Paceibacterota bacterium]
MKKTTYIIIILVVAVGLTFGLSLLNKGTIDTGPGEYDELAQCLADKGVIFYGAFWCPHCAEQKKLFGASAKLLPYVECSTPDAMGQLQVCKDKKIESYPTWIFADGSRLSGTTTAVLAEKSGCSLVSATSSTPTASSTLTES